MATIRASFTALQRFSFLVLGPSSADPALASALPAYHLPLVQGCDVLQQDVGRSRKPQLLKLLCIQVKPSESLLRVPLVKAGNLSIRAINNWIRSVLQCVPNWKVLQNDVGSKQSIL